MVRRWALELGLSPLPAEVVSRETPVCVTSGVGTSDTEGIRARRKEPRVDYGERTTGTRDEHYNLISVLYHALHGAENCDRYAADAEVAGDERLAAFFREAQVMQTQLAERAKGLLGIGAASDLGAPGVSSEGRVGAAGGPEVGVDVGPGTISGGAQPVAEVPSGDVTADIPEPTSVRVPPEDFETTIRALEGGPEELGIEAALEEIDGWRLWLEASAEPELLPIAEDLGRLGDLLRSGAPNPAEVGRLLGSLGERVRELADSDVGAPVAERLRILGGLLNTAARAFPE
jgi:hypothetical protein